MGTSQSSRGSPSGVPMVPPWVPELPADEILQIGEGSANIDVNNENEEAESTDENSEASSQDIQNPVAQPNRFGPAKRCLSDFGKTGDPASMRKGVGRFIKKGYGGKRTATKRLSGTIKNAQTLFNVLSTGLPPGNQYQLNLLDLKGYSAFEVMDAVVEAILPVDGTQDTESSRASIKDALSEVLSAFPDADLTSLNQQQKECAIENFVGNDVYRRIELDLGAHIRKKAPDTKSAMSRMRDIKNYVKEAVAASFKKLRDSGKRLTATNVNGITKQAISETCSIFEEYAE